MDKALAYGYRRHPEGLRAVWGARLIAPNDLVWDRQDLVAEGDEAKAELTAWLNGETHGQGALKQALDRLARIPLANVDEEALVYEDEQGRIVGNTQASWGYVYVAAWLHEHAPCEWIARRVAEGMAPEVAATMTCDVTDEAACVPCRSRWETTPGGRVLGDRDFEALADEAERGA